jgi:cell division protein FtsX
MGIISRFRVYIIMIALFSAILGIFYWYYQDSQKALKQYAENQSKLEVALQTQIQVTEKLQQDLILMQQLQQ